MPLGEICTLLVALLVKCLMSTATQLRTISETVKWLLKKFVGTGIIMYGSHDCSQSFDTVCHNAIL